MAFADMPRTMIIPLRLATAITVWLTFISILALAVLQYQHADALELPVTAVVLSAYPLMLVRWSLALWLLLKSVRAKPLRLLPRAFVPQAVSVLALHTVLGVLSLIGFLGIWVNTRPPEHAMGVVLHLVLPPGVLAFIWHRNRTN